MMYDSFRVPEVPYSNTRVGFHNASPRHELSADMQRKVIAYVRSHVTVNMDATREIYADWFSRIGLRFRIKMRLYKRIIADAMQRRRASYSIS